MDTRGYDAPLEWARLGGGWARPAAAKSVTPDGRLLREDLTEKFARRRVACLFEKRGRVIGHEDGGHAAEVLVRSIPTYFGPSRWGLRRPGRDVTLLRAKATRYCDEAGIKQRINVPSDLMAVLTWHTETQLATPEQQNSELLFPPELGGFRGANCLQKPFRACAKAAGLDKRFTPRGMRRTFNDLARRAKLESIVIKSVSGHRTEAMKDLYSTVGVEEQREGIGLVLSRVKAEGVEILKAANGERRSPPTDQSADGATCPAETTDGRVTRVA
jgi:integrase